MRLSGLASGMDTESIIKDMMNAARLPLDKIEKKQQTLEWKRDEYRAINTSLLSFRNQLTDLKLTKNYRVKSATSSDVSKIEVKANNLANVGSTSISNVSKLARAEVIEGSKLTKDGKTIDTSTPLFSQLNENASELKFTLETPGKTSTEFVVTKDMTMTDVVKLVNDSNIGVNMFYDSVTGKVSLSRAEAGVLDADGKTMIQEFDESTGEPKGNYKQQIQGTGTFLALIGIGKTTDGATELIEPSKKAHNAVLTINGIETQRNSNTFTEDGITYTIKETFTGTVSTRISNDTEAVYENIKGFIDKYNELISSIQGKINEERNKNYEPLTDTEREELSEKQIEKWENLAKSGMLRNDTTLSNALSKMRLDISNTKVGDSTLYNTLAKIGITTTNNYLDGGKLVIDEQKLKEAIESDPVAVEKLFRGEDGVVQKLSDTVSDTMENIKLKAGSASSTNQTFTIGREMLSNEKRISSFQDRLEQLENRYWKQFTAMEKAIQRANEQSASLMQFFSN